MTLTSLTLISLALFILFSCLLAFSFTDEQMSMHQSEESGELDNGTVNLTYTRYQKVCVSLGAISFGFLVVHGTLLAASLVKELM